MRSDLVVVETEGVESALLGAAIGSRRNGGFGLEIAVHAFVASVLVGRGWLDEIGEDAELDPPDGEGGESAEGRGGKGDAVVGANALGEAKLTEEPAEDSAGGIVGGAVQALAAEEIATEAVLDGEGVAVAAVAGLELALEVGGPNGVGRVEGSRRSSRMVPPPAPTAR